MIRICLLMLAAQTVVSVPATAQSMQASGSPLPLMDRRASTGRAT